MNVPSVAVRRDLDQEEAGDLQVIPLAEGERVQATVVELDGPSRRALIGLRGGRLWAGVEADADLEVGASYEFIVGRLGENISLTRVRPPRSAPPAGLDCLA
jgi:hypothetical protein